MYDNARFAKMVEISADEGSEIRESSRNNICYVQCDVLDIFFNRFRNSEEQRTDAIYSIPFNGAHMPNNSRSIIVFPRRSPIIKIGLSIFQFVLDRYVFLFFNP